jgi:predicted RNA binding protein YcfA (HicA-like mRNA interferase family)
VPNLKCTFQEFIAIIEAHGFRFDRQVGSHRQYVGFIDGRRQIVTVACHSLNEYIQTGTLQSMIRQSNLPKKLFRK